MPKRKIVIGDVHGCSATLKKLLYDIIGITLLDELIFVGDYIDRGPDSKGVVDEIIKLRDEGIKVTTLMGNHEEMLISSYDDPKNKPMWDMNGAESTMKSFGIEKINQLDDKYVDFFKNLDFYYESEDFVAVHAGLNWHAKDPFQDFYAMLWMRPESIYKSKIGGRRLIVGHTPKKLEEVQASLSQDLIFIDGGCVYKGRLPGIGYLCGYDIVSGDFYSQINVDGSNGYS